ncbi:MAG: hypothetical protein GZ094_01220 [Mariniphaga sp.]|nr:hypothetical protein [Mariniphaga sp.]
MSEFTPKIIGSQNTESYTKIKGLYQELIGCFEVLKWEAENLYSEGNELPISEIIDLLNKNTDLESYLRYKFVTVHEISVSGINTDKLIMSDLLDLPESYGEVIKFVALVKEIIEKICPTYFYVSLSSLKDEISNSFNLNDSFETKLRDFTTVFTKNEMQNTALEAVQKWCDATNDLIELGLLPALRDSWCNVGDRLRIGILNRNPEKRPLTPDPRIFNRHFPLARFGDDAGFVARAIDRNAIMC